MFSYKIKFHGSCFLVASSSACPTRATSSRGCYEDVGRVGWLLRSTCHTLNWSVGRRSAAVYYCVARLSVCRVFLQIPRARHARLVADKSLASSQHRRPTRPTHPISSWRVSDIFARMLRRCNGETAPVEFQLYWTEWRVEIVCQQCYTTKLAKTFLIHSVLLCTYCLFL